MLELVVGDDKTTAPSEEVVRGFSGLACFGCSSCPWYARAVGLDNVGLNRLSRTLITKSMLDQMTRLCIDYPGLNWIVNVKMVFDQP